jgi:thiamine-phosphate pyrophosphorylase
LCLVTDRSIFEAGRHPPEARLVDAASKAVSGGVNMVQLREKGLPGRDLLALAREVRKVTRNGAIFIVNDRVDVAIAAGADGVQLGEQSMPISAARQVAGDDFLIGRSVHDLYGAEDAEHEGADFLVVGTIFQSRSHLGLAAAGPELITEIREHVSIPVIGIGGITAANATLVLKAGASGVAVIGAILDAVDHRAAAAKLADALALTEWAPDTRPSTQNQGTKQ